ncbi:hypothetical protein JTB14_036333 [Gonioctena quinquepunctata]|nr:hypothetical protein JTB14_036333 [Gonioctena quinquepunctata]
MSKFVLFFGVSVVWCAAGSSSNPTTFPVAENEVQPLLHQETFENVSQFQWFSQLYDHHRWWSYLEKIDIPQCKDDMMVYLKELANDTSWAVKMFDASGRYSAQFFFGNDYWLGSKTWCEELANVHTNSEVPPFAVHFYVAKIRINLNRQATPVTRQLNLGECLPESCGVAGIRKLLAQERNQAASVNIVGVRQVPGDYSLLSDFKVHLVGGCSLVVLILIIISSIVEILRKNRFRHETKYPPHVENNNNSRHSISSMSRSTETVVSSEKWDRQTHDHGIHLKILLSFSAVSNGKKILSMEKISLESIKCIHGLRFFSIAWIILVHTYLEVFALCDNKKFRILTERGFMFQTISNATFSVDTFFFISGLLVTLTYFRSDSKKKKPIKPQGSFTVIRSSFVKFLLMLVYRFFRLTPAYMFVLGLNEIIMRYLHSNSVFSPAIVDHISCDNYWWRNALYINNFYPQHEFCMLWSWYIANDTQFYVIASVLLLIGIRGPKHVKFVAVILGFLMAASWITTFFIAMKWDYVARVEEPFALFDQLYDKPWLRIGPYLIGIVTGYTLFRIDSKILMSPSVVTTGWILSLSCLGSLVYGLGREGLVVPASAFYAALGHSAWGLSLAWITVACCSGYGGPLNSLLSSELFLPLSRLTYCAYLIHPVLMCLTSFHLDGPMHLDDVIVFVIYCGNVVISFATAFVISIAFEAPLVNLLKVFFS